MSLEPKSPLYDDSIALQVASWNKDFEIILVLQFSTLREIGKFGFFDVGFFKFLFFLSCFLKWIVNVSHSLLFSC